MGVVRPTTILSPSSAHRTTLLATSSAHTTHNQQRRFHTHISFVLSPFASRLVTHLCASPFAGLTCFSLCCAFFLFLFSRNRRNLCLSLVFVQHCSRKFDGFRVLSLHNKDLSLVCSSSSSFARNYLYFIIPGVKKEFHIARRRRPTILISLLCLCYCFFCCLVSPIQSRIHFLSRFPHTGVKISSIKRLFSSAYNYIVSGSSDSPKRHSASIDRSVFSSYRQIMANIAQSSICGIGLGAENCYVAVARQGGIEILLNEYSQYSTPAYIGLGASSRDLGTSAKQKQFTHLKSTYFAPSLLLGKKYSELDLSTIPFAVVEGPNDTILVSIEHAGEQLQLTPTQLLAMVFTKLRQIGGNPVDCVINCPNFFNDIQRREMMDAAAIAGLNPLKLINDTTAVALFHGFYRTPAESKVICFFDVGQSSSQVSIYHFNQKENTLKLLDTQFEASIGGRNFDALIADHFIETQKLELNARARYRLIAECEKLKKQMSANSNDLPISIECLYNDRDFSGRMDRTKFVELAQPLFHQLQAMLQRNLDSATEKFNKDFAEKFGEFKIDSVEVFGGSSRVPAIKQLVKTVFGIEPSTTLNADEAVARGCALQCAILSPNFKIAKALNLLDASLNQLNFGFGTDEAEFKWVKFLRGTAYPVTKKITGTCKQFPIHVTLDYIDVDEKTKNSAKYCITEPAGQDLAALLDGNQVTFRLKFDHHGIASLLSATLTYEKAREAEQEAMELENGQNGDEKMEVDDAATEKKSKPKTVSVELSVQTLQCAGQLTPEELNQCINIEANLVLADKNWKEKTDAKNALEEFIYEWREKLSTFDVYIAPTERESFQSELEANENWLYEQDDQDLMHSKSIYDERTNKMKQSYANKILSRKHEFENLPAVLENLGHILQQASKFVDTAEEAEKEQVDKLQKEIGEKQKYFDTVQGQVKNWNPTQDAPVTCEQLHQNCSVLQTALNTAHSARKRLHDQRKKEAEAAAKAAKEAEEKAKAAEQKPEEQPEAAAAQPQETAKEMDVE